MKQALLALLVAAALAGCADSGGDDPADAGGATASSTITTTGPPPKPVVTTETIHWLGAPDTTLLAVTGPEASTPTSGFGGGPGGGGGGGGGNDQDAEWTYQVTANSTITGGEVHVWIEIIETLLPQPFQGNPTQPTCTWLLVLELGGDVDPEVGCLSEPPGPINAGIKELTFNFVGLDAEMEVNETITMSFLRTAFGASTESSVNVLSGSAAHDSYALLKGLKEALPDA